MLTLRRKISYKQPNFPLQGTRTNERDRRKKKKRTEKQENKLGLKLAEGRKH